MKDEGSSLLEVLIAVMIMALAGVVLVGGLYMSKIVTDRTTQKQELLAQFSEAANFLYSLPFRACPASGDKVYPTPFTSQAEKLGNVKIVVLVLDTSKGWGTCSESNESSGKGVQKIIISNPKFGESTNSIIVKLRG